MRRLLAKTYIAFSMLLCGICAYAEPMHIPAGSTMEIGSGELDAGSYDIVVDGTVVITSGSLSVANLEIGPAGRLEGGSGVITVAGNWINAGQFDAGTGEVVLIDGATSPVSVIGDNAFYNLTITSSMGKRVEFPADSTTIVEGDLIATGVSSDPVVLASDTPGEMAKILIGGDESLTDAVYEGVMIGPLPVPGSHPVPVMGLWQLIMMTLGLLFIALQPVGRKRALYC